LGAERKLRAFIGGTRGGVSDRKTQQGKKEKVAPIQLCTVGKEPLAVALGGGIRNKKEGGFLVQRKGKRTPHALLSRNEEEKKRSYFARGPVCKFRGYEKPEGRGRLSIEKKHKTVGPTRKQCLTIRKKKKWLLT